MLKIIVTAALVSVLAATSASAMCCGGKSAEGAKVGEGMQCAPMKMEKADVNQSPAPKADEHAGMDMSGSKKGCCGGGCCCGGGENKSRG